jgi:hypothetical protein
VLILRGVMLAKRYEGWLIWNSVVAAPHPMPQKLLEVFVLPSVIADKKEK